MKPQNINKIIRRILVLVVFVGLIYTGFKVTNVSAATGIYRTINFQGKIVNKSDGTNIGTNNYNFTFKLYDAASGGNQLPSGTPWSETQNLPVTDGIFRATIGASTPFPSNLDFNSDSLYLDITFNGETFGSRVRLTAVPYAFNAEKVNGLTVTNTTGTLTIPDGTTIAFSGANNLTLATSGTTSLNLPTTGTLATLAGSEALSNKTIDTSSTGLVFSGGTTDITTVSNQDFTIVPNGTGMVGIGTVSPQAFLDVAGSASVSGNLTIGNSYGIQSAYGPLTLNYKSNPSAWTVGLTLKDSTGYVGIGTVSPTSQMQVFSSTSNKDDVTSPNAVARFQSNMAADENLAAVFESTTDRTSRVWFMVNGSARWALDSGGSGDNYDYSMWGYNGSWFKTFNISNATGNITMPYSATVSANLTSGGQLQVGRFGADPAGLGVGSMYYNTNNNKFRCFINSAWADCDTTSGSPTWSAIQNPSTNLSLAMNANTTTFTWNTATGASTNLFNLKDTASNTGTGYLLNVETQTSSNLNPLRISARTGDSLVITSGGNIGINSTGPTALIDVVNPATNPDKMLQLSRSLTATNSTKYNMYNDISLSGATLGTSYATGLYNNISATAESEQQPYAYGVQNIMSSSQIAATGSRLYGAYTKALTTGDQYTFSYGYYYATDTNTAGGTHYGFYADMSAGSPTSKTGIYLTGETSNYFSGDVGIGTSSPLAKLDVRGNATVSGNLTLGYQNLLKLGWSNSDPSGTNGSMYYNSNTNTFRCYVNGAWANCGGSGSQTPWTSDIVAGGYDLTDLSNILFRETTGAPTGTDVGFYRDNSGDLTGNVLTNKALHIAVNGTDKFSFSASGLDMGGNSLTNASTITGSTINLQTANSSVGNAGDITLTTGNSTFITGYSGSINLDTGTGINGNGDINIGGTNAYNVYFGQNNAYLYTYMYGSFMLMPQTTPGTPQTGQLYIDSGDSNKLKWWNGGSWQTAGGGVSTWSSIGAPTANLNLNMYQTVGTSFATTFTFGDATGSTSLFNITDTALNSGTGYLFNLSTQTGSTAKPFYVSAAGTGAILVDSTGNVGIGSLNPGTKLDIVGSATVSGNLTFTGVASTIANRSFNSFTIGDNQTGNIFLKPKGGSSGGRVQIGGGGGGSATPSLLLLDIMSTGTIDPVVATNGAMYYNQQMDKLRCKEGGVWKDCDAALAWSGLAVPGADLSLAMSTYKTTFNWATGTGSNNLFNLTTDASSNGTGYLMNLATGTSSTVNPFHVSAAGTEALLVNASGNVGIGTISPTAKLDIAGNASFSGNLAIEVPSGANAATIFDAYNGASINFRNSPGGDAGATSRFFIANTGDISMGTTTASSMFHINGTTPKLTLSNPTTTPGSGTLLGQLTSRSSYYNADLAGIKFEGDGSYTGGTYPSRMTFFTTPNAGYTVPLERMRIDAAGNVGIGTTTTTNAKLELDSGTSGVSGLRFTRLTSASTPGSSNGNVLTVDSGGNLIFVPDQVGSGTVPNGSANGDTLRWNGSQWTANNIIYNDGTRVGIGSTSPTQKLDVTGNATVSGNITMGGQLQVGRFASDPATSIGNGGIYYNTTTNKFRCYQNSVWTNCIGGDRVYAVKGSDENVPSGTTLQNDDALSFAVGSGETWIFDFALNVTNLSSATPDWKAAILGASGWTCNVTTWGSEPGGSSFPQATTTDCDNVPTAMVNGTIATDGGVPFQVRIQGVITTNSSGTVYLQWAPNTSGSLTVLAGSYVIAQKVNGADLAEAYYAKDQTIEPGDVVSLDAGATAGVKKSAVSYDENVLGVISTKPGLVMGDVVGGEGKQVLVALSGRIPVKVSTESGTIRTGDYLTSSSTSGVAMKAVKAGYVIGQALEDDMGKGTVLTFIKNTFYSGGYGLTGKGETNGKEILTKLLDGTAMLAGKGADVSGLYTDRVVAGMEIIAPHIIADLIDARELTIGGTASASAGVRIDSLGNASFSGTLSADVIRANHIAGLDIITESINNIKTATADKEASISAAIRNITVLNERVATLEGKVLSASTSVAAVASSSGILTGSGLQFNSKLIAFNGLTVLGRSNLDDLFVGGTLQVGLLGIDGMDSSVSATGGASLTLGVGAMQFKAQEGLIFASKSLFNQDVEFAGKVTFNKDTAGYAVVKSGDSRAKITFGSAYSKIPVVNISLVSLKGDAVNGQAIETMLRDSKISYAVTDLDESGFTIMLSGSAPSDLRFSWSAFMVKEADTSTIQGVESSAPALPTPTVATSSAH